MTRGMFAFLLITALATGVLAAPMPPAGPMPGGQGQEIVTGNLAIRAVQGTAGAEAPSGNAVEVHFFHNGQPFQQIKGTLNEMGLLVLNDVPVSMGVRPLVRVEHGGVTYQDAGPEMNAANPDASVEVTVYETTNTPPAWRVLSRQAVVTAAEGRLLVSESVFVDNPNDRTWLGGEQAPNGKLTTVELTLPARTEGVTLTAGFHGWCCTTLDANTLTVQMPLMPGRYNYQFAYEVPAADGTGTLELGAPVETEELAVIVPESGIRAEPDGLTAGSVQMTEQGPLRLYSGRQLTAAQTPSITLTGLPVAAPARTADPNVPAAPAPSSGPGLAVWLVLGAVAVVGLAIAVFVRR